MAQFVFLFCLLIISIRIFGLFSYGMVFTLSAIFYLLLFPLNSEEILGLVSYYGSEPTSVYWFSTVFYYGFYLLGVSIFFPLTLSGLRKYCSYDSKFEFKSTSCICLLFIAFLLVVYSVGTRNVFKGEGLLFTIIGFDLLLICFLSSLYKLKFRVSIVLLSVLIVLFTYAGFRYRLAILVFGIFAVFWFRSYWTGKLISLFILAFVPIFLALFGQVRRYGSFGFGDLLSSKFDLISILAYSGEFTVSLSTVSLIENVDRLRFVYLEPILVSLTHFIPSSIWADKPRVSYLGSFLNHTFGLDDSGVAIHDLGQVTQMFGLFGIPFVAFAFGMFFGFVLSKTVSRVYSNSYYVFSLIFVFAFLIPSRGYFVQQLTWAFVFSLPAFFLYRRRAGV